MADVTFADVNLATQRVLGKVHKTPIMTSAAITNRCGLDALYFKVEAFQKTGSFKFRGATNAVGVYCTTEPLVTTFVTHSSGNHGQAVAKAARDAGKKAIVVVPSNAPKVKVDALKEYGADVQFCEPTLVAREAACARALAELGAQGRLLHPFDDRNVIAGQGTLAVELISQLKLAQQSIDAVIVPVGGGGMISGVALAIKHLSPRVKVFGAEPANVDDASRSFYSKSLKPLPLLQDPSSTMADGLRGNLSARTLALIRANVDDIFTVDEAEMAHAMELIMERLKVVIEPSAATGVAVALFKKEELRIRGVKRVAIVLCGGNVVLNDVPRFIGKL